MTDRDTNHPWAVTASERYPPPWKTCDGALSETFDLVGSRGAAAVLELLRRQALLSMFSLGDHTHFVVDLMAKYADMPISMNRMSSASRASSNRVTG